MSGNDERIKNLEIRMNSAELAMAEMAKNQSSNTELLKHIETHTSAFFQLKEDLAAISRLANSARNFMISAARWGIVVAAIGAAGSFFYEKLVDIARHL